ncbi:uncharacterized protein B0I36DRAFT_318475 [Microdochium trichocladiopsis]|uniref:Uncharacterized protein n=1 Tax=Microdochium trichocladiopsis TaxID=1682393 RepID=A0A9P9BWW4_9PEZI|nr:uncharacterized protein B0I36DRAFT_318475 [Microdochium trichocladiopsis]KAH7035491.1 hypothetical protein B0I36DRAFT_318475 [Microdochium trichocladiopsis]
MRASRRCRIITPTQQACPFQTLVKLPSPSYRGLRVACHLCAPLQFTSHHVAVFIHNHPDLETTSPPAASVECESTAMPCPSSHLKSMLVADPAQERVVFVLRSKRCCELPSYHLARDRDCRPVDGMLAQIHCRGVGCRKAVGTYHLLE